MQLFLLDIVLGTLTQYKLIVMAKTFKSIEPLSAKIIVLSAFSYQKALVIMFSTVYKSIVINLEMLKFFENHYNKTISSFTK